MTTLAFVAIYCHLDVGKQSSNEQLLYLVQQLRVPRAHTLVDAGALQTHCTKYGVQQGVGKVQSLSLKATWASAPPLLGMARNGKGLVAPSSPAHPRGDQVLRRFPSELLPVCYTYNNILFSRISSKVVSSLSHSDDQPSHPVHPASPALRCVCSVSPSNPRRAGYFQPSTRGFQLYYCASCFLDITTPSFFAIWTTIRPIESLLHLNSYNLSV